jgi:BirA family transcriptional regulator, biotin operon repressor / biotin---[acetyl-CoA-carboxylase] ligase
LPAGRHRGDYSVSDRRPVEPGKNLTFSIILRTTFLPINRQFYLNIFTSLAIRDYLHDKACPELSIKWPNDVYAGTKKIGGILVENQILGNKLLNSVVGIGLNMNQQRFEWNNATALTLITEMEFELQAELEALLAIIEARYLQLKQNHFDQLMRDYLNAMYWLNEIRTFQSKGSYFDGKITGVNEAGQLIILTMGEEKSFGVKEISYVS